MGAKGFTDSTECIVCIFWAGDDASAVKSMKS